MASMLVVLLNRSDSQFKFDFRLLSVNSNPVNTSMDAKLNLHTLYCYGDFEELNSQEISGLIMNWKVEYLNSSHAWKICQIPHSIFNEIEKNYSKGSGLFMKINCWQGVCQALFDDIIHQFPNPCEFPN